MHLHATHYRLEGARENMTVSNIVRRLEAEEYVAAGIVEHLDTQPKHPLHCLEAMVAEFRPLSSYLDLYVGAELDYQQDAITISEAPAIKHRLGLDYYLGAAHGVGEDVTNTISFIEDHHRERGRMVLVHCGAGLGRSGTVAACFLVHGGMGVGEAIARVRELRPFSVETAEQEQAIEEYARLLSEGL